MGSGGSRMKLYVIAVKASKHDFAEGYTQQEVWLEDEWWSEPVWLRVWDAAPKYELGAYGVPDRWVKVNQVLEVRRADELT